MKFTYTSGARPLDGYTIKRGVGIGGFGEVYFATSDAGKEVALKRVQRNLDIEVRGVTQCLNLKHPNLIALYDIKYDDEGEGWIVMEYVTGASLKDIIDRNPNGLPRDELVHWFRGIASGVVYLHDHGIVHRDLKPGNIFMDEDVVKIGDYGLSKFISCSRRSGQTESVGTFHYMAPEIGKGVYGKEIDVYALGIMLYEMLTGTVPFNGESSQEIIMKHLTAEPELVGIPQPYRKVIERALFKDPAKRYSSVTDMLHALQLNGHHATTPAIESSASLPPVVDPKPAVTKNEPIYISDDADDMVFGPVIELVTASAEKPPVTVTGGAAATAPEPIARAVRENVSGAVNWWHTANLSTPIKVVLLVIGVFVLVFNLHWVLPLAIVLGAIYLVYFGIRSLTMAGGGSSTATGAQRVPSSRAQARNRQVRWHERAREDLKRKPSGERMAEITGSMLLSAIVASVLSMAMLLITGFQFTDTVYTWSLFAWMAGSSTVAAWSVLLFGKMWESSDGDHVLRRFTMLAVGLVIGAAVFGTANLLMVDLNRYQITADPLLEEVYPQSMFVGNNPLLPAYMAYFGGLFLILRWWKQADPLRRSRLSLVATAACVLWSLLLPLSQPWCVMLAATISVAVQLSAPWMSLKDRAQIRHQTSEA